MVVVVVVHNPILQTDKVYFPNGKMVWCLFYLNDEFPVNIFSCKSIIQLICTSYTLTFAFYASFCFGINDTVKNGTERKIRAYILWKSKYNPVKYYYKFSLYIWNDVYRGVFKLDWHSHTVDHMVNIWCFRC